MQNHVYRSRDLAIAANAGRLCLAVCANCGFAFNGAFDAALLHYDQDYDNSVPSAVTGDYYQQIARYLKDKYLPDDGLILDIGCGKGTFLKTMCRQFPQVRGVGIDPSYEGPEQDPELPLRFIRDFFAETHVDERPKLIICRHVLEHIERPIAFLQSIRSALRVYPEVPVFFEVPDLGWIIRNQAFWDFCYEHCNYFTPTSLSNAMSLSGFRPTESRSAFGDQYLWIEAVTSDAAPAPPLMDRGQDLIREIQSYVGSENSLIARAQQTLNTAKENDRQIAIWGMATKGILFSCLVDPTRTLFDYCVDVNQNKQGCYVPSTGHRIDSPEILRQSAGRPLEIVVMNPNYLGEIKAKCYELGLSATFMNANGETV